MPDIIAPLNEEERAVLMIAAQGQYLIPIGIWEAPIKSLAARGFLKKLNDVNYVITDAGRKASDTAEDDALRDYVNTGRRLFGA